MDDFVFPRSQSHISSWFFERDLAEGDHHTNMNWEAQNLLRNVQKIPTTTYFDLSLPEKVA